MKTVTLSKKEYVKLKKKAQLSEGLLVDLVKGLEDIKHGKIKPLKK